MLRRKAVIALIGIIFCIANNSFAQQKKDSASSGAIITMSYAAELPGADLAKRFGYTNNVQLGAYWKFSSNWFVGAQGAFIFGNKIKENVLDSIATKDGNIIANDGNYTPISYFERGFDIQLTAGKVFPVGKKKNLNSGIVATLSAGYINHHIRIENPNDWAPQANGSYIQGYDRLTAGVCITEFAGYQYISKNRILNFFAGLEFTQGFTKSLRYDFDLGSKNNNLRYDLLNGIRVGWILPILKKSANGVFYTY